MADSKDTTILPPDMVRPDYSKWSEKELLIECMHRFDAFEGWRQDVDRRLEKVEKDVSEMKGRLGDGDHEFRTLEWNISLLVNATQAICLERGLDEHASRLGEAKDAWQANRDKRRSNGQSIHEVPTNPENEKPDPEGSDAE